MASGVTGAVPPGALVIHLLPGNPRLKHPPRDIAGRERAGGKRKELPTEAPAHTLAPGLSRPSQAGVKSGAKGRGVGEAFKFQRPQLLWGSLPPHLPCAAPLPPTLSAQGLLCPCPSQLPPSLSSIPATGPSPSFLQHPHRHFGGLENGVTRGGREEYQKVNSQNRTTKTTITTAKNQN